MSTLAVPQAQLNWRVLSNVSIGATGSGTNDYRDFWLKFKQILCNVAPYSGAWKDVHGVGASDPVGCSVLYSSNGTNYGAQDYITTLGSIIGGNISNPSYLVLSFPGMGANAEWQMVWGAPGGNFSQLSGTTEVGAQPSGASATTGMYFAQSGGFATNGGIATRRCWAATEVEMFNRRGTGLVNYLGGLSLSTTWTGKLHVIRTADGSRTRAFFFYNGVPIWTFFLEVPSSPFHTNAVSDTIWNGDQVPWFGASYGSGSTAASAALYNGTPNWAGTTANLVTRLASNANPTVNTVATIFPVLPYSGALADYVISLNATAPNAGDGGYYPAPVGLACGNTGYVQPYLGTWQDMYFVGNNLLDGSGAEDVDASGYSWRKIGNFMVPWDRSVIQMS